MGCETTNVLVKSALPTIPIIAMVALDPALSRKQPDEDENLWLADTNLIGWLELTPSHAFSFPSRESAFAIESVAAANERPVEAPETRVQTDAENAGSS